MRFKVSEREQEEPSQTLGGANAAVGKQLPPRGLPRNHGASRKRAKAEHPGF